MLGALACGIEIGFSAAFANAGGIMVTVPSMLSWHVIIGLVEASVTTTIFSSLQRLHPEAITGLTLLRGEVGV